MFSPILGSRCLATILVVINGAAVPAPARTLAPPISPAPGAAAMTQSPQPNRVLVSVCAGALTLIFLGRALRFGSRR